jgi:hypothetical protein
MMSLKQYLSVKSKTELTREILTLYRNIPLVRDYNAGILGCP